MSVEDLAFPTEYFLNPTYSGEIPLILCTHSTKAEGTFAVRFREGKDLVRPNGVPFSKFVNALGEFRDTRQLGDDFLLVDGFEKNTNRQRFVEFLGRPVVFGFDGQMLENANYQVPVDVSIPTAVYNLNMKDHFKMLLGIFPKNRFHVFHLQIPVKPHLAKLGLEYSSR